jgi:Domain of unknown function (DUF6398)
VAEFDQLNIPKAVLPVAAEVIKITDEVCAKLLDAEYAALARQVIAKLARKRPSPLLSGRRATWAAGVVYARSAGNVRPKLADGLAALPAPQPAQWPVVPVVIGSMAHRPG